MNIYERNLLVTATQRLYAEMDRLAERDPGYRLGEALSAQLRQTVDDMRAHVSAAGIHSHDSDRFTISLEAGAARRMLHDVLSDLRAIPPGAGADGQDVTDLHRDIARWLARHAGDHDASNDDRAERHRQGVPS